MFTLQKCVLRVHSTKQIEGKRAPPVILFLVIADANAFGPAGDGEFVSKWTPTSHQRCSIEAQDDEIRLRVQKVSDWISVKLGFHAGKRTKSKHQLDA